MNTKALRQKVLDLAIHGKLVPQNPNDESAEVLLKTIRDEKAEKIKKGELKADKKDSFIFVGSDKRHYEQFADGTVKDIEDEIPFEVPEGWAVARMGTYITFTGGSQPPKETFEYNKTEENIRLIQIRDYKTDEYATYIPKKLARRLCSKTDVMIGRYGPPLFQILRGIEGAYNVALMKAESKPELIQNDYLYYLLQDGVLLHFLESLSDRTCGQDGVNMYELNNYLILIPPYEEQSRIIHRIEETLSIINNLSNNIGDLEKYVKLTKNKILDLAIHGKLVPQDPKDEPAEELLKRIATSDNRPYEKLEEEPFEIPSSWSWVKLSSICTKLVDGDHNPPKGIEEKTDYIMASSRNINYDRLDDLENVRYLTKEVFEIENERTKVEKGDLFFTSVGTLGRSCIYDGNYNVCFQRSVTVLRTTINNQFLKYYFDSDYYQNYVEEHSTGTAQMGFYLKEMANSLIAVPPIEEQKRIVSKIQSLFLQLAQVQDNLI